MKRVFIFVLSLTFTSAVLPSHAQQQPSIESILDSLEVLKQIGAVSFGHSVPPSAEEQRIDSIEKLLRCLPVSELKKLMRDEHPVARAYGFVITTRVCLDSITIADKQIFNDTARLNIYTRRGIRNREITLGELARMAYVSAETEKKFELKRRLVIAAVKDFIKMNAKYPASYEDKDFHSYYWNEDHPGRLQYQIVHSYTVKNAAGVPVNVSNIFLLDKDLKVISINENLGDYFMVRPEEKENWLKTFAKRTQ